MKAVSSQVEGNKENETLLDHGEKPLCDDDDVTSLLDESIGSLSDDKKNTVVGFHVRKGSHWSKGVGIFYTISSLRQR